MNKRDALETLWLALGDIVNATYDAWQAAVDVIDAGVAASAVLSALTQIRAIVAPLLGEWEVPAE